MAKENMNRDVFEQNLLRHGVDVGAWPENVRGAALSYAATTEGQALLEAEKLLDEALQQAVAHGPSLDHCAETAGFQQRLAAIPASVQQKGGNSFITWLINIFVPVTGALRPRVVLSQLAVFTVVLGLGVAAGASGLAPVDAGQAEVDISDGWFQHTLDFEHSDDVLEG